MNGPTAAFSVRDCDLYLEHLVQVCADHQLVVATDDVSNEFGVVLLRAGTPLGAYAVDRMRGHRLLQPVDVLLELRRSLTPEDLVACFVELVDAEPDLRRVGAHFGVEERVRHLCHTLDWPAQLLQKLSVLQLRLPKVFHRALFVAWFGTLLAAERKMTAADIGLALQAGLFHDLGLLHIPPALVDKKSGITAGEWDTIQSHVAIGARLLAQSGIDDARMVRVVAEHHERHDGAGYPAARVGADLDPVSPIVALGDILHALRFQSLLLSGNNLADCMPYLKVNRRTFGKENYTPAARILAAGRDPAAPVAGTRAVSVQGLIDANRSLAALLADFAGARGTLQELAGNRTARSLVNLIEQVQWVSLSSGLGNQALEQWLHSAFEAGRADPGVVDVQVTAQEVFWLVRRFDRLLKELVGEQAGRPEAIALKDLSLRVGGELTRAWRRFEGSGGLG
jgi:putative nucleotidyltransferase with HDIG domain